VTIVISLKDLLETSSGKSIRALKIFIWNIFLLGTWL